MGELEQISRAGLTWILIAQAAILAPHVEHAPLWLWAVWAIVVLWRVQVFRGAWPFPGRLLKLTLIVVCCGGLLLTLRRFNMQAMVVLLLIGFILKLLEMKRRRDFLALCYLGYFVIATQFLFFSNVIAALYGFICVVLLTTALLAVNQSLEQQNIRRSLRISTGILLRATPILLLLFILTPRLGPLWAVPNPAATAQTGMSDTMSPGDFNQLTSSNEPAFRVTFLGSNPTPPELYWRGLVLSRFDGRTWYQSHSQMLSTNLRWTPASASEFLQHIEFGGRDFQYEIIIEPSHRPWVYALAAPRQWQGDLGFGYELRLQHRLPITQRLQYSVTSTTDYRYQVDGLAEWQREQELALPRQRNPQTHELAQRWLAEAGSPQAYIEKVLQFYRENFTYTLQPDLLGEHSVDEFLLTTRRGFCEHFSSSFVVLMRAAGIPARVVVGYQGGSYNPSENYWLVRQRDAHAWAEVWLAGQGWVRIDPTAAVAPERIERGIDYSLNEVDSRLLGNALARRSTLINQLSMYWDAVDYNWTRWVLSYNSSRQQELLGNWFADVNSRKLMVWLSFAVGCALIGWLWVIYRGRRIFQFPADRYYLRFAQKLARVSLAREVGESPQEYAARVGTARPDLKTDVQRITTLYEVSNYGGNDKVVDDLARAVRRFSP